MWQLSLLVIGTCIYSGVSLDHYSTFHAPPINSYPPARRPHHPNIYPRYPSPSPSSPTSPSSAAYSNSIIDDYGSGYGNNAHYVCPPQFVRSGNSCYYLSAAMETWQNAHYACKDMGADLARMEKKWEDKNMRIYLGKPELAPLERWIGGIYDWELKSWLWGASAKRLRYQGFSRRKPNSNNRWNCIVMDPAMMYRWGARSCVERKHFICEKRLKNIKPKLSKEDLQKRKAKRRRMRMERTERLKKVKLNPARL